MRERLGILAGYVRGDSLSGFFINYKNNAGVKRNNRPKFIGNQVDGVAEVQRRANGADGGV